MSMIKIASADDWKGTNDRLVVDLKISSRGFLPNDSAKVAAELGDRFIHEVRKIEDQLDPKRYKYAHVISCGATEITGCFVENTPIAMIDGTYLPVQDVRCRQSVLTADGNYAEVTTTYEADAAFTVELDVVGLADPLVVSPDHPFRVAKHDQFVCDHDKYKRCLPPIKGEQHICNRPITKQRDCVISSYRAVHSDWMDAREIKEKDFLVWTAPQNLPIPYSFSPDEGYLLGAFLADGCFVHNVSNGRIRACSITVHNDETEFLAKITEHAKNLGLTVRSYNYPLIEKRKNERTVAISGNPELFRRWYNVFGEKFDGKKVPPWVCCLPLEVRLAIIAGYLDGDGSCCVNSKENRTTARSHGELLSLGIQRLCWSAGIPAVRCHATAEGWNVSIANSYLESVEKYSWKVNGRQLSQTTKVHSFFHEGRMYLPVRRVTIGGPRKVYNIEVAGDHSYSGPNVDSHNCNRNGDGWGKAALLRDMPSYLKNAKCYRDHNSKADDCYYGLPKVAFFDEARGFGRLLCEYFATKEATEGDSKRRIADLEIDAMERGDDVKASHGTKITFDTCSICGNDSTKRSQYCESKSDGGNCPLFGCKHGLTKISDDGEVQFVHNDDGNIFYDISSIGLSKLGSARQADRIAYISPYDVARGKIASFDEWVPGSAWLADQLGMGDRNDLFFDPNLTPYGESLAKLAIDMSELPTRPSAIFDDYHVNVASLRLLASDSISVKCSAALDLANRRELIGPRIFAKVYGCDELTADKVAACTRGIYRRIKDAGMLSEFLMSSPFTMAPLRSVDSATGMTTCYAARLDADRQRQLVKLSALRDDSDCKCDDRHAGEIAIQYAAFKLAVVSHILRSRKENLALLQ